jgi:HEAT repeat protein
MRHPFSLYALAALLAAVPFLTGCGGDTPKDVGIDVTAGTQKTELEKLAAKGIEHLKGLLKSEHVRVRMDAAQALSFIRDDPEATKLLIEMIEGDSEDDTATALMALGAQGPPEAKAILQKYIKDPRAKVRGGACIGIAEYGDSTLFPLLDEVAADDPDPTIRRVAAVNRQQLETGRYVPFAHKKR